MFKVSEIALKQSSSTFLFYSLVSDFQWQFTARLFGNFKSCLAYVILKFKKIFIFFLKLVRKSVKVNVLY